MRIIDIYVFFTAILITYIKGGTPAHIFLCRRGLQWRRLYLLIFFTEVIKFYWLLLLLYPGELYRLLGASSFTCNLWSYCSMHDSVLKTKNRPLDLFYTDCINPNSVTIRPSLYEIFVFSFFTDCCFMDIYSTSQYFSNYVIGNFADTSMKPF